MLKNLQADQFSEWHCVITYLYFWSVVCHISALFCLCFQRDSAGLTNQNNELKFRLQAMEQQAQLKDGMNTFAVCFIVIIKLQENHANYFNKAISTSLFLWQWKMVVWLNHLISL